MMCEGLLTSTEGVDATATWHSCDDYNVHVQLKGLFLLYMLNSVKQILGKAPFALCSPHL